MKKTIEAAIKTNGLLENLTNFIIRRGSYLLYLRENLVIICTGSQGEKRSALYPDSI